PPSAFCFSTTAVFSPSWAARIAATYPPVPAPITMTSYSWATCARLSLQRRQRDEGGRAGMRGLGGGGRLLLRIEAVHARTELSVLVPQFPIRFGEPFEPFS